MTATSSGRYDGDSWDAASSVGVTATMVATARAMATRAENPLITDPYAEPLVRAVGIAMLAQLASGELDPSAVADLVDGARLADMATVRTKFYDEFFLAGTQSGIGQVVILASGLDSRAYRLSWPAGTVVYEVDQPQVIAFKTKTLAEIGASPSADRRTVPIDLRDDWITALRTAGFDPGAPTVWSAEGLLGYLPPEAQDRLLDTITESSAPGSRLATESIFTPGTSNKERLEGISRQWQTHGFDPDMSNLVYFGERHEPATYLADRGWQVSGTSVHEMFAAHGLPPFDPDNAYIGDQRFLSATR